MIGRLSRRDLTDALSKASGQLAEVNAATKRAVDEAVAGATRENVRLRHELSTCRQKLAKVQDDCAGYATQNADLRAEIEAAYQHIAGMEARLRGIPAGLVAPADPRVGVPDFSAVRTKHGVPAPADITGVTTWWKTADAEKAAARMEADPAWAERVRAEQDAALQNDPQYVLRHFDAFAAGDPR